MSEAKKSRRKRSKHSDNCEVTGLPDQDELNYLEKVVLGTGADIFEKSYSEEESSDEETVPRKKRVEKKAAWVDEDDDVTFDEVVDMQKRRCNTGVRGSKKYQKVMEETHQQIMGLPKWCVVPDEKTPTDDILKRSGNFVKKPTFLDKELLMYKKLKSLNYETQTEGSVITVVKFHPKSTVGLVAGSSGVASIFEVDGKKNRKLHSLQFPKYPVSCGSFLNNGEELLVGSKLHKFLYCYNLITGQTTKVNNSKIIDVPKTENFCVSPNDELIALYGNNEKIYLFATSSKEYVDSLQMNCNVTAVDFNQSCSKLYSHGEDGEVYIWDLKSRTCITKFYDDGCITGTSISVSENDQLLACGSSSGVVNIYDNEKVQSGEASLPLKSILNLVTPTTTVKFNSTGEILAFGSKHKDNAIRLFHCSSMTTFSNFPPFQSVLGKTTCMDFSPNSGYFVVGNNKGHANLFRLKHYGNY